MGQENSVLRILNCSKSTFQLQNYERKCLLDVEPRRFRSIMYPDGNEYHLLENNHPHFSSVMKPDELLYIDEQRFVRKMHYPLPNAFQRPIYLFAHQMNQPENIQHVLNEGANGCEIDVMYRNSRWYVQHHHVITPTPTVEEWFKEANMHARNLVAILVDIKPPCSYTLLQDLLNRVRSTKFRSTVIYSVATNIDCIVSIAKELHINEGLATDFLDVDEKLIAKIPENANLWYGNGAPSSEIKPNLYSNVESAIFLRDNGKKIKKVYVWTLNSPVSVTTYLEADVDGMIVEPDFIATAKRLIQSNDFVRLATLEDHPFTKCTLTCKDITENKS